MKNPEDVLNNLRQHAGNHDYKFRRLYRNFYNPEFYLQATLRPASADAENHGEEDADTQFQQHISRLIERMRDCSYQPQPARPGYERAAVQLSPDDKLVLSIMKQVLEAIWEPVFLNCSHGYRPERSCHTALLQVQARFTNAKWFVEGDLSSIMQHMDPHLLAALLRTRVEDERFIDLVWKFMGKGYIDVWTSAGTYSASARGTIIAPVLSNILFHELDMFVMTVREDFDTGNRRRDNPDYTACSRRIRALEQKLAADRAALSEQELKSRIKEIRRLRTERTALPCSDPYDQGYKRLQYVRYADSFLMGVIGSREDAEMIKERVGAFLTDQLGCDVDADALRIVHGRDKARFLGYEVTTSYSCNTKRNVQGVRKRQVTGSISLHVPKRAWVDRLKQYGALKIRMVNGQEVYEPVARGRLIRQDDLEILRQYNAEIQGLYNYYRLANNVSVLNKFKYVMEYSMYKTFAAKYRTSVGKIRHKYRQGKDFAVGYKTKNGTRTAVFYNKGFQRDTTAGKRDPDAVERLSPTVRARDSKKGCKRADVSTAEKKLTSSNFIIPTK